MSEAKHTKGPWHVGDVQIVEVDTEEARTDPNNSYVHDAGQLEIEIHGDNAQADARLVAAAPDMLAVLTELIDMLLPTQAAQARLSQGVQSAVIRARTTIAKATGGPSESKP